MSPSSRRRIPGVFLALSLAVAVMAAGGVRAQEVAAGWDPRSGDVWVDIWLGDMNRYGARYPEPFVDEIVRYHGAPRELVEDLLARQWLPGDIYFACGLASLIGRPCRYVADLYEADREQGWGVIASRLGIKPGSPEFHRLKKGFVHSYDRWARPIELDDALRREYPNRGRSGSARKSGRKSDKPAAVGTGRDDAPGAASRKDKRGDRKSADPRR